MKATHTLDGAPVIVFGLQRIHGTNYVHWCYVEEYGEADALNIEGTLTFIPV